MSRFTTGQGKPPYVPVSEFMTRRLRLRFTANGAASLSCCDSEHVEQQPLVAGDYGRALHGTGACQQQPAAVAAPLTNKGVSMNPYQRQEAIFLLCAECETSSEELDAMSDQHIGQWLYELGFEWKPNVGMFGARKPISDVPVFAPFPVHVECSDFGPLFGEVA